MTEPSSPGAAPSSNRGIMIVLAYLWLLALVPLLVEKADQEVQWHAKHGIVLMVAELIFWIAYSIVISILGAITAGLGCVMSLVAPLFSLAILAIHIIAIVKGINGQRLIIPGISEYANRF
jgi:uncharacterized membrane protein